MVTKTDSKKAGKKRRRSDSVNKSDNESALADKATEKSKEQPSEVDDIDEEPQSEPLISPEERYQLSRSCPYLDTIDRTVLDFDFEKLCSVSLHHLNVYACLVCGKYFQGRGCNTHAHTHALSADHHVFLNLESGRFYCLPEDYEIIDGSLADIRYLLNPTFGAVEISRLHECTRPVRAYDGNTYYPGIVCLNNIKANDYCNVVLHLLTHVAPLRDYFLREANYRDIRRRPGDEMILLVQRFGELFRKIWNPSNFKTHVSPHEFLQAVVICSKKRFQFTEQGDCLEFLSWLLNSLDQSLRKEVQISEETAAHSLPQQQNIKKKKLFKPTVIGQSLTGSMHVHSKKVIPVDVSAEKRQAYLNDPDYMTEAVTECKFRYLTCDLPPPPLYPDELKKNIIPQVPLFTLLAKFNGATQREYKLHKECQLRRFLIQRLPPFLCLYVKRIVKNLFTIEKNPTIVNFPIRAVDFGEYLTPEVRKRHRFTTYNLIANIVHDGPPTPGAGSHRIHLLHRGTGKWFELQDLHVKEILPQMITLSESLVQMWEVDKSVPNPHYEKASSSAASTNEAAPDEIAMQE